MTKADLIKMLDGMDDDAQILLSTKHNDLKIKAITDSKVVKYIWIDLVYDDGDDDNA
jgi:hypothetical protein